MIHEIVTGEQLLRRGQGRPLRCAVDSGLCLWARQLCLPPAHQMSMATAHCIWPAAPLLTLFSNHGHAVHPFLCREPEDCPAAIVKLVERCLQVDPSARPTAAEAVEVIAANIAAAQSP